MTDRGSRKPRRLLAAGLAGLALTAAACGGGGVSVHNQGGSSNNQGGGTKSGPLELAVVPKAVGFDYWTTVKKGAMCAADKLGKKGGNKNSTVKVDWTGVSAETDVSGQVDLLQNFITKQVDGMVFAATDSTALQGVVQHAKGAGIPVVEIDSGTKSRPSDVPLYATNNEASAVKAAGLLADALGPGKHKVAMIEFQPGAQTNTERARGFKKGLKKHPNLKLVADRPSHSDVNKARQVTENILTANPDIDGIFAANEPSVIGASSAVKEAGKLDKVKIVGWDAAPDEIKALKSGEIYALVVQNPFKMGYVGVKNIVAKIRKGKSLQSMDTGVTFVTKKNMGTPDVQSVLHPSCENPPV
ncbi:MAG: ABC transporter substrate-binding protein [Streptosporangiaceae bacterium]